MTPLCTTCNSPMIFIGEYLIVCGNVECRDYDEAFEYGGQDYPVQLADARQSSFQWDDTGKHENILEHSQE